ncbi:aldose 1-epimerase [Listeria floridensis FSL S10-1187]|uniref:Aldose 1-epimerase n=1 Tax=Listeria floridensis FSL S10-1187 TaxID=1265817 RepID=A0ABP3AWP1_9LIST|nr:aldose epimerase family protein [Listeria floridensis]EUJ26137.1 aldose 1-epimerase [Listeria floridensis FSL S10-1187]
MKKQSFGLLANGQEVNLFTFETTSGMRMTVTDFGAALVRLEVPDREGKLRDVVLGYDDLAHYETENDAFFGAIIGRNANRTKGAAFELGDTTYFLEANEGKNNLHSGSDGYHLRPWTVKQIDESARKISFELVSEAGDQGFPGKLIFELTYELKDNQTLSISYRGIANQLTVFNPTSHSYFNLNGAGSGNILNHELILASEFYTPVQDADKIPTGEIVRVAGTPFDFREAKTIGRDLDADNDQLKFTNGYDHNYVLAGTEVGLQKFAMASGDESGIVMEVATNSAGVQFYTGNFVDHPGGKGNSHYQKHAGFCLETQFYPNSLNESRFKTPILQANQPRGYVTEYTFSTKE